MINLSVRVHCHVKKRKPYENGPSNKIIRKILRKHKIASLAYFKVILLKQTKIIFIRQMSHNQKKKNNKHIRFDKSEFDPLMKNTNF